MGGKANLLSVIRATWMNAYSAEWWGMYPERHAIEMKDVLQKYLELSVPYDSNLDIDQLREIFESDDEIASITVNTLQEKIKYLKTVITADQIHKHKENPWYTEFPEPETLYVESYLEAREALQWVYSLNRFQMALNSIGNDIETAKPQPTTPAADQARFIVEAIRQAAKGYELKAPRTEEEQRQQDLALNKDQKTVWYDPDYIKPLHDLFCRKWFESEPEEELKTLRNLIDQQDISRAVGFALYCWKDELLTARQQRQKPSYSQFERVESHISERQEKLLLQDFKANEAALNWLIGIDQQQTRTQADRQAKTGTAESLKKMSFEEYCLEQIKMMEPDEQRKFLIETKQGDGLSCGYGLKWMNTYNQLLLERNAKAKTIKTFSSSLSRAKNKQLKELIFE